MQDTIEALQEALLHTDEALTHLSPEELGDLKNTAQLGRAVDRATGARDRH